MIDSLPHKPLACPICGGDWILSTLTDTGQVLHKSNNFNYMICKNHSVCRIFYIEAKYNNECFYLKKTLASGIEIWWEHNFCCEIKRINSSFEPLTFILPFTITDEQLQRLMVFS